MRCVHLVLIITWIHWRFTCINTVKQRKQIVILMAATQMHHLTRAVHPILVSWWSLAIIIIIHWWYLFHLFDYYIERWFFILLEYVSDPSNARNGIADNSNINSNGTTIINSNGTTNATSVASGGVVLGQIGDSILYYQNDQNQSFQI